MVLDDRDRRWAAVYAHRERLLRVCRARLGSAQDAEDCVQEAMLRCVEFADLDEARLGQFLTTVTVRLCADVHRGRARGERLHRRLTYFVAHEPGPEETVCDRAETVWLSRQVETLTPRQRAIVEARAEGLSCGAVAERVAVSYTAVESAMARVRRSMRLALESTFGVAAVPKGVRRLLFGALAASAAVVTIGHLPGELGRPSVPRVVALPPAGGGAVTTAAARTTSVTTPLFPAALATTVAAGRTAPRPRGRQAPRPVASAHAGGLGAGVTQDPNTPPPDGRVERCLHNGYAVADDRAGCRRYPPGDPRNPPEELGTPPIPTGPEW